MLRRGGYGVEEEGGRRGKLWELRGEGVKYEDKEGEEAR